MPARSLDNLNPSAKPMWNKSSRLEIWHLLWPMLRMYLSVGFCQMIKAWTASAVAWTCTYVVGVHELCKCLVQQHSLIRRFSVVPYVAVCIVFCFQFMTRHNPKIWTKSIGSKASFQAKVYVVGCFCGLQHWSIAVAKTLVICQALFFVPAVLTFGHYVDLFGFI